MAESLNSFPALATPVMFRGSGTRARRQVGQLVDATPNSDELLLLAADRVQCFQHYDNSGHSDPLTNGHRVSVRAEQDSSDQPLATAFAAWPFTNSKCLDELFEEALI